jgi:glycosyltransferase involved in cell wall biosynthesis
MAAHPNSQVVILGYDKRRIAGGVVTVTDVLLENLPNTRLHPVKHCYKPASLALWLYLVSLVEFVGMLVRRRKTTLAHAIVASRGDWVRTVPILLICALFRVPVCLQYHTNIGNLVLKRGPTLNRLLNRFYRLGRLHVFLSPALRREFLQMAPGIGASKVINNALPRAWMGLAVAPLRDRDIDVVFFGRWSADKGIDVLLEYLRAAQGAIRCEIYSDHLPELGIQHTVVKPWVGEDEVRSILRRARLLVLPSFYEAYPTVILEALACGTPFVASDIGGIPDIAGESEGGVLVKPGDAQALGVAIEALLTDSAEWARRSERGWEWVNRTCNAERVVSLWRETYASIDGNR